MNVLLSKILSKKAVIGIMGLGTIGLALFEGFRKKGFKIVGYDRNLKKIRALQSGKGFDFIFDLSGLLASLKKKTCAVSAFPSILKKADVLIFAVNLSLDQQHRCNKSLIDAVKTLAQNTKKNSLIIIETTAYPGMTEEEVVAALEALNLKIGKDVYVAYVPEILDVGNKKFSLTDLPRIIGGVTPDCFKMAEALYKFISSKIVSCSSPKIAESAKLLQNSFRLINISFINEMKIMFDRMGIDTWEVIEKASVKPFGFMPFYPSAGIGGMCIPITPFYFSWKTQQFDVPTSMIDLAFVIDQQAPLHVVEKIEQALGKVEKTISGAKILILGVAFKKDINQIEMSPSIKIISLLQKRGSRVFYHDPHVPYFLLSDKKMTSIDFKEKNLKNFDCVVIAVDHSAYKWEKIFKESSLIVDIKNVSKNFAKFKEKIFKA